MRLIWLNTTEAGSIRMNLKGADCHITLITSCTTFLYRGYSRLLVLKFWWRWLPKWKPNRRQTKKICVTFSWPPVPLHLRFQVYTKNKTLMVEMEFRWKVFKTTRWIRPWIMKLLKHHKFYQEGVDGHQMVTKGLASTDC